MMRILACRQGAIAAMLVYLALLVSGCTFEVDVTSDSRIDVERPTGSAAIPLSIGVYFSPEFLAFEDRARGSSDTEFIIKFGRTSADLFDGVFSTAFEEVHFVEDRPPLAAGGPPVAAVIEPRIERAAATRRLGDWTVELVYLFGLYDMEGNLVVSWTFSLAKTDKSRWGWLVPGGTESVQDAAMKQAGANLMRALYNDPKIAQWLKTQGIELAGS